MKVNGKQFRSIWFDSGTKEVRIIDQRYLPHKFVVETLASEAQFATAIRDMWVRGAPLIGVTAAYGIASAMQRNPSDESLCRVRDLLLSTRPTAVNLKWALDRACRELVRLPDSARADAAMELAHLMADEDVEINRKIGQHGLNMIREIAESKESGEPVRVLTHCNAGWLATVDWGTATSPMYHAHDEKIPLHVWVDETRPRNQGALTAWELGSHGIDHSYVVDNAGGHLMQKGLVDVVITGTDRTTSRGDVCNKIGTYLKALAAFDNHVPFFVALPSPTIDWTMGDGIVEMPIEDRSGREVSHVWGIRGDKDDDGDAEADEVQVVPDGTASVNPAFDVTPGRLVSGLITERGIAEASPEGLTSLFPDLVARASES